MGNNIKDKIKNLKYAMLITGTMGATPLNAQTIELSTSNSDQTPQPKDKTEFFEPVIDEQMEPEIPITYQAPEDTPVPNVLDEEMFRISQLRHVEIGSPDWVTEKGGFLLCDDWTENDIYKEYKFPDGHLETEHFIYEKDTYSREWQDSRGGSIKDVYYEGNIISTTMISPNGESTNYSNVYVGENLVLSKRDTQSETTYLFYDDVIRMTFKGDKLLSFEQDGDQCPLTPATISRANDLRQNAEDLLANQMLEKINVQTHEVSPNTLQMVFVKNSGSHNR